MKNTSYFKIKGNRKKRLIKIRMIRFKTRHRSSFQEVIEATIGQLEFMILKSDQIRNLLHFKEK